MQKIYCCYCQQRVYKKLILPINKHYGNGAQVSNSCTIEHLIPISKGGTDLADNRLDCCYRCNNWRNNKDLLVWLLEVEKTKPNTDLNKSTLSQIQANIIRKIKFIEEFPRWLYRPGFEPKEKPVMKHQTKICYLDAETTGTKHWRNGIHQLSGGIEIDGVVAEWFDLKMQPNPKADIEDEALAVSGVTRDMLATFMSMEKAFKVFTDMLAKYVDPFNPKDKFFIVGYNNRGFDVQFLRAWFIQNNNKYFGSWFWADSHDVLVLASNHLKDVRHTMKGFKLMTVARQMGIEVDESRLHDAIYDIKLTRAIYNIINF